MPACPTKPKQLLISPKTDLCDTLVVAPHPIASSHIYIYTYMHIYTIYIYIIYVYIYIYIFPLPQDPPGELYATRSVSPSKHWAFDSNRPYTVGVVIGFAIREFQGTDKQNNHS